MKSRSNMQARVFVGTLRVALCVAAGVVGIDVVEAKPRAERITERRIIRLEAMERRMEAAAQMPPRPMDVRRAIRSGAALPAMAPNPGLPAATAAAPAARGVPGPSTRAATPPPVPARPAPATIARPTPQSAPQPALRFPDEPAVVQQAERAATAAGATPSPVTPATAIDDGTSSVLVGGAPTPGPAPAELLPTPQPK
jgi:hypothetical protein